MVNIDRYNPCKQSSLGSSVIFKEMRSWDQKIRKSLFHKLSPLLFLWVWHPFNRDWPYFSLLLHPHASEDPVPGAWETQGTSPQLGNMLCSFWAFEEVTDSAPRTLPPPPLSQSLPLLGFRLQLSRVGAAILRKLSLAGALNPGHPPGPCPGVMPAQAC